MRVLGPLIALLFIVLFALGVPRFLGAMLRAPGEQAVVLALEGQPLRRESYQRAVDSLTAALSVEADRPTFLELGIVHHNLGRQAQDPEQRDYYDAAALDAFEESLLYSPVQPVAWSAIAEIRFDQGDLDGAAAALDWSTLAAYHLEPLQRARALLGTTLWHRLAPATQPRIIHAIVTRMNQEIDLLARLAVEAEVGEEIIAGLRAYDPGGIILAAKFDAALRRHRHAQELRVAAMEKARELGRRLVLATSFLVTANLPIMSAAMTVQEYRAIAEGEDPTRTVRDLHDYLTATLDGLLMLGDFNRRQGNAVFCVPRDEIFSIDVQEFRVALDAMIEQIELQMPDHRELFRTRSVGLAALQLLTMMYPCDL